LPGSVDGVEAVVVLLLALFAGSVLGVALFVGALRRRVRLRRGPVVPLLWGVSPARPAVLHRRLRRIDQGVARLVPSSGRRFRRPARLPSELLALEVGDAARRVDTRLRAAAGLPVSVRQAELTSVEVEVRELEDAVSRLAALVVRSGPEAHAVAERVRRFDAALGHLDAR
jgi:hypothetical protein